MPTKARFFPGIGLGVIRYPTGFKCSPGNDQRKDSVKDNLEDRGLLPEGSSKVCVPCDLEE